MQKTIFMDKYPVYTLELINEEIKQTNISQIIEYLKEKIETHPVAKFITVFDHYKHTQELNGDIMDGLIDAQNIIFCFGKAIPNTKILAARPRSVAIAQFEDKFIVEFIEAPNEQLHDVMEAWVKELSISEL